MKSQPLVSVIVPAYNQARYLPDAIDSLRRQTYPWWECIIINDGSTDDTPAVCRRLAESDHRVRYLDQDNRGLAGARDRGLDEARGDFIQFLDADDLLFPEKFELQLAEMQRHKGPSVAYCRPFYCIGADVAREIASTRPFPLLDASRPLVDLALRWEKEVSIPCHTFLFDARLITGAGIRFDESLPNHEDFECWMRVFARKPRTLFIDRKLVVYRRHEVSMCRNEELMREGFIAALSRQHDHHADKLELRWILQRRIADLERGEKEPPPQFPARPLVSVILTSYNYQQYVGEAIRCVFRQSYRPIELVIVDDGSVDRSTEVIREAIADAPIPVKTIFKPNGGQSSAFNAGYKKISGQIVTFLDSDDLWYDDRVEKIVDFMHLFPGGGVYQHQLDTGRGPKRNGLLSADVFQLWKIWGKGRFNIADDHDGALFSPFLPTSGLAFRRSVLDKVFPIPEELITCPDAFMSRTSVMQGPLLSLPLVLGLWRDHDDNSGKRGYSSFEKYWQPVIMPRINAYYKRHDAGLELYYDVARRSSSPAARILGESSVYHRPAGTHAPEQKGKGGPPPPSAPGTSVGVPSARFSPQRESAVGTFRRRFVTPFIWALLPERHYRRLRAWMVQSGWIHDS